MNDESGLEGKLTENPLLARLARESQAETMTFWGYIGPSAGEGVVTLHSSLENASDSIEIPRADILHVEDVPETVMLFGAKVLWVRRDAVITRRQADTAEATGTLNAVPETGAPAAASAEMSKGRVRMAVRTQGASADCHSPCATCKSCSSVCISSCRYVPPTTHAQ